MFVEMFLVDEVEKVWKVGELGVITIRSFLRGGEGKLIGGEELFRENNINSSGGFIGLGRKRR